MRKSLAWSKWVAALVVLTVALLAVLPAIEQEAQETHRQLFQRALVTFALARTLNGVISVAQGTELALQPAGVGLTLTPGEILDPVNDLVERFSWVMLGATVSLGLQRVLMEMGAWWPLKLIIAAVAAAIITILLMPSLARRGLGRALFRILLVTLFLRFAIPLALFANETVYAVFLQGGYAESTAVIREAGADLEALAKPDPASTGESRGPAAGGLFGGVQRAMGSAAEALNLRARVEELQKRANAIIEHVINLSVVFVMQTAVLPIAFLWLFLALVRWCFRMGLGSRSPANEAERKFPSEP